MRQAIVYYKDIEAGHIYDNNGVYIFEYSNEFIKSNHKAISLTLPKSQQRYESDRLFSFFYGLLSEGFLKDTQCKSLKIDENDTFGRLIKTCSSDTIGCVTVKEML
jgi:serine/threonine-protein kinase HipA